MDEEDTISELTYEKIYTYAIYLFGGLLALTVIIWCACIFCCNCLRRKKVNQNGDGDDDILAADPSMSKQDLINLKKRREQEKLAK